MADPPSPNALPNCPSPPSDRLTADRIDNAFGCRKGGNEIHHIGLLRRSILASSPPPAHHPWPNREDRMIGSPPVPEQFEHLRSSSFVMSLSSESRHRLEMHEGARSVTSFLRAGLAVSRTPHTILIATAC